MSAIPDAINWIMRSIPKEVLEYAFEVTYPRHLSAGRISMNGFLHTQIINRTIVHDYNIIGAVEERYLLSRLKNEVLPTSDNGVAQTYVNNVIYYIPKELTQGRTIISVSDVIQVGGNNLYGDGLVGGSTWNCDTNIQSMGAGAIVNNALGGVAAYAPNFRVSLLSETAVLVEGSAMPSYTAAITVMLGTDQAISNLKNTGIIIFRELAVMATKMYIYTTCAIKLDEGVVRHGVNISRLKDIIDSYSDAAQMYQEYFKGKFIKVARMSDTHWQREWNDLIGTNAH